MKVWLPVEDENLSGMTLEARVVEDSCWNAVLVVQGRVIHPLLAAHLGYVLLSASADERSALQRSGYQMAGLCQAAGSRRHDP
jgi:hypothetical protein